MDDSDRDSLPSDYALPPNTGFESIQIVAGKGARLQYIRMYILSQNEMIFGFDDGTTLRYYPEFGNNSPCSNVCGVPRY